MVKTIQSSYPLSPNFNMVNESFDILLCLSDHNEKGANMNNRTMSSLLGDHFCKHA